jgi:carbon storage regulator
MPHQNKGESTMLVLSRKKNERVMIGDEVEIVIVEIRGDKVRLGISAPTNVAVDRAEVREAIQRDGGKRRGDCAGD